MPVKTKIAVCILLVLAVLSLISSMVFLTPMVMLVVHHMADNNFLYAILAIVSIVLLVLITLFYFLIPILLLRLSVKAWKFGMIFLTIIIFANFAVLSGDADYQGSHFQTMWAIVVLVLLYVDRKNYFAAVEMAKGKTN